MTFFEQSEIPVAPEDERRRIVAKLDALQSRTRLARESLAAIPTLTKRLERSLLVAACSGRLTGELAPEDASDERPAKWMD
jgi:type I restriction enzyme S subunit